MKNLKIEDAEEPDLVRPCPNCGGEVGVFLKHFPEQDTCSIQAVVHSPPEGE